MLPEHFLDRMKELLGEEYEDFLAGFDGPSFQSLRVNLLKGKTQELAGKVDFLKEAVPWAAGGYYYQPESRPGKHPFHEAGVYYIQEASAPAAYLAPKPGERVLDLCAAPGGKSTQLACAMMGKGLLVCNEIHPQRAKILSGNIERMGIGNALVVNHEPAYLAERFPSYFDKILVDAPCSGEGMFRKNPEAVKEWSPENVKMCAARQQDILESAALMLKPGGRMVYSTCTFAPEEDEETINRFLENHPEFYPEETEKYPGMTSGIGVEESIRLWPHKLKGEGHFLGSLRKKGGMEEGPFYKGSEEKGILLGECGGWEEFSSENLKVSLPGAYIKFGEQLYLLPTGAPLLTGLKVLRPGLHLGAFKKNRFEPAHALALFLKPEEVRNKIDLSAAEAVSYLSGQTFPAEGEKGWYLLSVEGYSIGWGKLSGGVMKNHYPKGLRQY